LITLRGKSNPEMKVGAEGPRHGEEPYPAPLIYVLENFIPQGCLDYNPPNIAVKYQYARVIFKSSQIFLAKNRLISEWRGTAL